MSILRADTLATSRHRFTIYVILFTVSISLGYIPQYSVHAYAPPIALKLFRRNRSAPIAPQPSQTSSDINPSIVSSNEQFAWCILVDQSKASLEKGGGATLDALTSLAPPHVQVQAAILPKSKQKPPSLRCISYTKDFVSFEVGNVDSVDKCHRVLTRHMKLDVPIKNVHCLKWKYKGNAYLEANKVPLAIDAYTKALNVVFEPQEGVLLELRATAYLRRAALHKLELEKNVQNLLQIVTNDIDVYTLLMVAQQVPSLQPIMLRKIQEDSNKQNKRYRQTQYRHGLYQYTLLEAAQDALRATQILPGYATCWLRAGEILSELWRLKESIQYYERAIDLDESLRAGLSPVIDNLRKRQQLLDNTRAVGWPEDTLRLALDVAG